jgi:hypothetical protein
MPFGPNDESRPGRIRGQLIPSRSSGGNYAALDSYRLGHYLQG